MKFIVKGFDKFNPRSDTKSSSWFRLENDWLQDGQVFDWNNDKRILWIYIVSLYSAKSRKGYGEIVPKIASLICKIPEKRILDYFNEFEDAQLVEYTEKCHVRDHQRNTSVTDVHESAPYERTNERTNVSEKHMSDKSDELVFDFESIYNAYPRKEGKTNGFKKLASEIKSIDDYNLLKEAVSNYANQVDGQDKKYIKLFSSFTSVWRDYIEVEEFGDPAEIARRKFCEENEAAEAEMRRKWSSVTDMIRAKQKEREYYPELDS